MDALCFVCKHEYRGGGGTAGEVIDEYWNMTPCHSSLTLLLLWRFNSMSLACVNVVNATHLVCLCYCQNEQFRDGLWKHANCLWALLWTCVRRNAYVRAILPAAHNSLLLGSSLSNADLLKVAVSNVLQLLRDVLLYFAKFCFNERTKWCLVYTTTQCFDLSTYCWYEGSRDVIVCTNTVEVVHQGCHLAHAQHVCVRWRANFLQ